MKKTFFVFFAFTSITLNSQDLSSIQSNVGNFDKEYLDSLPEAIRKDLLEKIGAKEDMDKPIYRKGSTMIDKPEEELKEMEKSKRFGAKIFDTMQSSFMPINEPSLDDNYVLGVGDKLEVQLIGGVKQIKNHTIRSDGSINLSDIGKIYIAGLSLMEASNVIKNKVSEAYTLTDAFVTLTNVRNIQILVSGNTYNPGIYTLSGNSNALHAISMAGGIDNDGSYRSIKIIRNNKVIDTLDLYDIFVFGMSDFGPRLRSGDSVFVSSHQNLVNIFSGVKRPAQYELKDDETFEDLIKYANGLSSNVDKSYIGIERVTGNKVDRISVESLEDLSAIPVQDGDALFLKEYLYRTVSIEGAVSIPGNYAISEGETLSSVIRRAGGYKNSAYPFGGYLENKKTLEINLDVRDKLYNEFLEVLLLKANVPGDALPYVLNELKKTPVSGRIIAEFDTDLISEDSSLDTSLENGDRIMVPYITQQVYVYGEVNNSGSVRYTPGKSINYYLEGAGGIKNSTDKKSSFVIHPDGSTVQFQNSRLSLISGTRMSDEIYPGSIIYVPRRTSLDSVQAASVWGPIISSLALSITSLSVLGND